jgi:two-component system, OmpR family, phosphate regulon sensor histidine kinase PhoR
MVHSKRNSLLLILIASSIALLVIIQFFWLRGSYFDAAENFRRQTSLLFRNTVFTMHDSLLEKSIQRMPGDSTLKYYAQRKLRFNPSMPFDASRGDSSMRVKITERAAQVEVFITNNKDSVSNILRPLMSRIQDEGAPQHFLLKINEDSLKVDSIKKEFKSTLADAGIDADFVVYSFRNNRFEKQPKKLSGKYVSEIVRLSPINEYAVSFEGMESYLLKEITPQILFSLFVTALTIGSFLVMYRNLRTQQKLMELKNDFISNVTHELKTPVATVSVALEALKNFNALNDPQRTAEYLEIAQNELNRLTLMTDKILKTSVFESQGVALKMHPMDLDELIQKVLSSMKLVFEKRQIELKYERKGYDFNLDASEAHLTNVLYNLFDNAVKYGGDNSNIVVTVEDATDKIILSVKDSGIGISSEYHKKIFEKFFRVPTGDVHNTKGYGLGLSYVASVIKSHDGRIQVESEPGKGSCFIIELPKHHEG